MYARLIFVSLLFVLRGYQTQGCQKSFQRPSIDCNCLGEVLQFECTVSGTGSTIWDGSAFSGCTGSRIVLRHSQFDEGTSISCNDGGIVGYSVVGDGANNCYTSRLNVTLRDTSLDGQVIRCTHAVSQTVDVIGNYTFSLTTGQNPPDDVHVIDIHQYVQTGELKFNWSLPTEYCPSNHYDITSIDCGDCPDTTNNNGFTCQNALLGETCNLNVKRVVCGNVVGMPSRSVSVDLRVPSIETIDIVPLYDDNTILLKSISTTFAQSESFSVSDGIDGSATSYTVTFTNPQFGHMCESALIPASHCVNRLCSHVLNLSLSNCSTFSEVNVTVFGTNILGSGPATNPVTIGYSNQFVRIKFRLIAPEVVCTFLKDNPQSTSEKRCSIVYGQGVNCSRASLMSEGVADAMTHSVKISLPELPRNQLGGNKLCFIITASDGLTNVSIEGEFSAGCNEQQLSDGTSVQDTNTCDAPLHSAGIKNGFVCFGSIDPGASAFYTCVNPDSRTVMTSVRTCLPNGSWNGSIPHCEGLGTSFTSVNSGNQMSIVIIIASLSGVLLIILTATVAALLVVVVKARKANAKLQHNLRHARSNAVYDEIENPPLPIRSNKNVAYSSVNAHITESDTK